MIFLLLKDLCKDDKDLVIASNYVDTLVSAKPMEKPEPPPNDILISFYDEDGSLTLCKSHAVHHQSR